jgi:thiosulfate/3-mercaptopyruvate sulfurtransferase
MNITDRSSSAPLVSTSWLAAQLGAAGLVVLDATIIKEALAELQFVRRPASREFETEGHIPGARFADLVNQFSDPQGAFPFARPTSEQIAEATAALGITRNSRVIVYDSLDGIWAARVWWVLRAFGHEQVAVLDGGLKKWRSEGRAFEYGAERHATPTADVPFEPRENAGAFVDKAFVVSMLEGGAPGILCNALRRPVFSGAEQAYSRPGRIPSSLSVPFNELVDPVTNALLPVEVLRERLADSMKRGELIVTYCGGGITAAGLALALAVCGFDDVTIYDGSLNEWAVDSELPMIVDADLH